MLISYKRGQGSIIVRIKILNSSVSTGAGLTGLTSASAGLIIAAIADNAAWDPSDAELLTCVGVIPLVAADYLVATDNQALTMENVEFVYNCTGTSLYGQLECVGTPTYASTADIKIRLQVEYLD